jgi:tetratricopeptide (TPR) repeat protein
MVGAVDGFAALLMALKRRSGLSFETLAHRSGQVSASTIHRYCRGQGVPAEYAVVERFAKSCGASVTELRELQRRWALADSQRHATALPDPPQEVDAGRDPAGWVAPKQLPAAAPHFVGRLPQLEMLTDQIDAAAAATVVVTVTGTAGVGKTALVVHWAHQVAERFGDGQLYVNLRGFDPSGQVVSPASAIRQFLDALGVPPDRVPIDPEAQAALYRSLLHGRRVLVVLDNARDAEQVRALLPGSPTCVVVVTSRNQLSGLIAVQGARPLTLDLITRGEAHEMLSGRLGRARTGAEPEAVERIITSCARLPLALAVVAARAATHPHFSLTALDGELRAARGRLDAFGNGHDPASDVRAVFSWSYRTLSTPAARLFRLLSRHPGPDLAAAAAANLLGIPVSQVRPLLAELAHTYLVAEYTPGRYVFHDLLRAYAQELADAVDSDTELHAAERRMLDYYLHTAQVAAQLLNPQREPISLAPAQAGVSTARLVDLEHALTWFTHEYPVLRALVGWAAEDGFDTYAWQLAWTLTTFLDRQGLWYDRVATHRTALAATDRLADKSGAARIHQGLANAYARLGRFDEAHKHLRYARRLLVELGDRSGQATVHLHLAFIVGRQGRTDRVLPHARMALELYRAGGNRSGEARALHEIGWHNALRGDQRQARVYCEQALSLLQELDDRYGQAGAWDSLGYIHHRDGDPQRAIACYRQSLDLLRDIGDRSHQAEVLVRLGDAHETSGEPAEARAAWDAALTSFDQIGHPDAAQVRAKLQTQALSRANARAPSVTQAITMAEDTANPTQTK